jgi:hypothetical protein
MIDCQDRTACGWNAICAMDINLDPSAAKEGFA